MYLWTHLLSAKQVKAETNGATSTAYFSPTHPREAETYIKALTNNMAILICGIFSVDGCQDNKLTKTIVLYSQLHRNPKTYCAVV